MLLDARGRMFLLERFAIQMLPSSGVGAFFIVMNVRRVWHLLRVSRLCDDLGSLIKCKLSGSARFRDL